MEFLGFATGHANDLPFAMSLVSPSYFAGQSALLKLQSNNEITPGDEGFSELEEILLAPLRDQYPASSSREPEKNR